MVKKHICPRYAEGREIRTHCLIVTSYNRVLTLGGVMKKLPQIIANANGKVGWAILWLLGVPIPVLLVLYVLRGCQ